jgi:glycosyltransferase involved in cell wall biosynthesis
VPDLSVVVCTRNRVNRLQQCFAHLFKSTTDQPWELIVVDNGSTDGTAEFLQSLVSPKANIALKCVRESTAGISIARNKGWRTAQSDIVSFTDDDCYVAPDYVDRVLAAFGDKNVSFVGGRLLLYDDETEDITFQDCNVVRHFPPKSFLNSGDIIGANMAFRKNALEAIGGFDTRMGAGSIGRSAEDTDALASVLWAGLAGIYDPQILVRHDSRRKKRDLRRLMDRYNFGIGAYYAKFYLRNESRQLYRRLIYLQTKTDIKYWRWHSPRMIFFNILGAMRFAAEIFSRRLPN